MMYNKIPIYRALTDSFTLQIPFEECVIIDKRLTSDIYTYYADLEIFDDEVKPPAPIIITESGQTLRISLVNKLRNDNGERVSKKFIELTVTAKLLRERYFEGINKNNIDVIYNVFMEFLVFEVDFETFLNSSILDIDVCYNMYVNSDEIYVKILHYMYNSADYKQKYLNHFWSQPKQQLGLVFKDRKSAKPSLPFIKMYHKEKELMTKSVDFWNLFLYDRYKGQIKNLTRVEATIKNYAHKSRLFKRKILPSFNTLGEYLQIKESERMKFISFSLMGYIHKEIRTKAPNLSPSEHLLFMALQDSVRSGHDLDYMLENYVNGFLGANKKSEKVAKTRMRKTINKLYNLIGKNSFKMNEKIRENEFVNEYLKRLQIPW